MVIRSSTHIQYTSKKRPPPSCPHLRKLIVSLLEAYAFPNVPVQQYSDIEWKINVQIPQIEWFGTSATTLAKVIIRYLFHVPTRVQVEIQKNHVHIGGELFDVSASFTHTIHAIDYYASLKGLCAMKIAKRYDLDIHELSSVLPSSLVDYLIQCYEDMEDYKKSWSPMVSPIKGSPDSFVFKFHSSSNNNNGNNNNNINQRKKQFSIGSTLSYHCIDSVLNPRAYFLDISHTERSISILPHGQESEWVVFAGNSAPDSIMEQAKRSSPRVLKEMLESPDAIYNLTLSHINKLNQCILAEAEVNLRHICDVDLAYSGGGLGGVTVELSYPTDEQRNTFIQNVNSTKETTERILGTHKHDLIPAMKQILGLIYALSNFATKPDNDLFLFERGFDWDAIVDKFTMKKEMYKY